MSKVCSPGSKFLVGALLATGMVGCQTAPKEGEPLLFFPAPPDRPRVQFLTWATGAQEVEPKQSGFESFVLGEQTGAPRRIDKPYGVAAHDGVVYVCDTKGLALVRMDFKNKTYTTLGTQGPGRLRKPINIAIDEMGYKFVVDTFRKQVVVFGPDDRYVTAHDIPEPCRPVDIALYGDELYVLDNDETCQIVVLDRATGAVVRTFGGPGAEPGQFRIPNSLCVSPDGYVYVSDTHNYRIQKLTRTGEPIWVEGVPGYRLGQFGRPRGIRTGPDGILYVVDGATELVQMYDPNGQILMRFGGPGTIPGAMILPATLAPDATSISYFQPYIHKDFHVEYLLFAANQYGPHLISVYAFGSFPEGYRLSESQIKTLPPMAPKDEFAPGEEEPAPEPAPAPSSQPAPQ